MSRAVATGPSGRLFLSALLAAAVLVAPPALGAQEPVVQEPARAILRGHVADSASGLPVPDVLVRLDTGERTMSDAGGDFELRGLSPGTRVLALLTSDCRVAWSEVELVAGEVALIRVELAAPNVAGAERERQEAHRRGAGSLVTAAEIRAMDVRTLVDVIRRVEPNMVARGRATFLEDAGFSLVVDGVKVADVGRTLDMLQPGDVETMELLPGPAAGWEYGTAGSSGVVRIETRRGGRRGDEEPAPDCVVPDFPLGGSSLPGAGIPVFSRVPDLAPRLDRPPGRP